MRNKKMANMNLMDKIIKAKTFTGRIRCVVIVAAIASLSLIFTSCGGSLMADSDGSSSAGTSAGSDSGSGSGPGSGSGAQ